MYKRMDANMFAHKLMEMEDNTSVVFANISDVELEIGEGCEDEEKFRSFYYAKKVYEEQYNSWYIIIDFINGGEAHVIALDWDRSDTENFLWILKSVQQFMQDWIPEIYVEVEE